MPTEWYELDSGAVAALLPDGLYLLPMGGADWVWHPRQSQGWETINHEIYRNHRANRLAAPPESAPPLPERVATAPTSEDDPGTLADAPPPPPPPGMMMPGEAALRAHVRGEIHLLSSLPGPPHRFQYATSPSYYSTAIVHRGRVIQLDSLDTLARYLREVDVFTHPEWGPHLVDLLNTATMPTPEGITPRSFSSATDTRAERRPRVEVGPDAVRLSLVYALDDGRATDRLFLRDDVWRDSEFGRIATADIAVRLDTHTLVIGREGPVGWTRTERRTVTEPITLMWNPERAEMLRERQRKWRIAQMIGAILLLLVVLWWVLG